MIKQYKDTIIRMVKELNDEKILKIIYSFINSLLEK